MRLVPLQLFVTVAFTSGQPTPPPDPAAIIQLAATGRCDQALSRFHQLKVVGLDKPLRRDLNLARVRCAISLNLPDEATSALSELRREFPSDSAVLFLAVHTFSDLSMRASQELLARAPESAEVHQLNAEALELQGKWNEARDEYRIVLEKNPTAPGVHYRIGRLLLSQPKGPTTMDEARREFEAELKINPGNVGSEFVLGEMARQADNLPEAIDHLTRATKLDAGFPDAFLALGQALLAAGRPTDAVPVMEHASKLQPANPATHFHLANAYRRVGRKDDAERAMLAHRDASEKARKAADAIQRGVRDPVVQ